MKPMTTTEKNLLFCFGLPDQEETMKRLDQVRMAAVDDRLRADVITLMFRLEELNLYGEYDDFFYNFRLQMEEQNARRKAARKRSNYRARKRRVARMAGKEQI